MMTEYCMITEYWENLWKSRGGIVVNGAPREVIKEQHAYKHLRKRLHKRSYERLHDKLQM